MDENNLDHNTEEFSNEDLGYFELGERDDLSKTSHHQSNEKKMLSIFFPGILVLFLLTGFTGGGSNHNIPDKTDGFVETGIDDSTSKLNKMSMVSASELRKPVMDTVYTDKDVWYELRVNEQHVYQHWRDGRVVKFPVSSGNKFISKSVEARPGLFAIFYRNPHHKSTQFDDASLYHFQTFNQGIGFHSLNGTGYYSHVGVRPSSHGCIRMKHKDAEQMYNDAEMGTLVLVHYGKFARTVGFAPKGYKNNVEYTNEEQKKMLAQNLLNVLNGNYYNTEREFFVVDPKVIPMSGIYVGYDKKLPKTQKMPSRLYMFVIPPDVLKMRNNYDNYWDEKQADSDFKLVSNIKKEKESSELTIASEEELVKKYFNNPIGILPYYPPTKRTSSVNYSTSNTSSESSSTSSSTNTAPSSPDSGE